MIRLTPIPHYFYQGDSRVWVGGKNQAWRMCYATTNAMVVKRMNPNALPDENGDDVYLRRLNELRVGDTTETIAQIKTLESFGIKAEFTQYAEFSDLEAQLKLGLPIPVGWLHHGHVSAPSGGGHWSLVIGIDDTHVYLHDPAGEADLVNGGYVDSGPRAGYSVKYSKKNWGPRWMVPGSETRGWALMIKKGK